MQGAGDEQDGTSHARSGPGIARAIARPAYAALVPTSEGQRVGLHWLTYAEAAAYCGWTVEHLRNLVSAGRVPVYGKPRMRRFRRDMLDRYLTDPDAAMRTFRAERNAHGG